MRTRKEIEKFIKERPLEEVSVRDMYILELLLDIRDYLQDIYTSNQN